MKILLMMLALLVPDAEGVLYITGASSLEDLDESTVERFESLREHPIAINCCSRSRLISCGLFSRYQVASLMDYRSRCGDVMSLAELSAVDGFGSRYASALREYITFEGGSTAPRGKRLSQSLMARAAVRHPEDETQLCGGVKYHAEYGDMLEFNWCDRTTYSAPDLGWGNLNISYYGRRIPLKLVAGAFNARFGQGLLVWSGSSMSGVSSPRSLVRNATGFSPSTSFSEGLHGIAADVGLGGWTIGAAYERRGLALANVDYTGRIWQAGMTACVSGGRYALSADWRLGFRSGAFYGEAAWDGELPACLAGVLLVPAYGSMLSAVLRAYPAGFSGPLSGAVRSGTRTSDEFALSGAAQNGWGLLTLDAAWHPSRKTRSYKALGQLEKQYGVGPFLLTPVLRASERCTLSADGSPDWRHDLRAELGAGLGYWQLNLRFNAVSSEAWAWLWYAELGWGREFKDNHSLKAWLRMENYRVDNWADRIYVYERDAPGSFNVPAYYGRGWNLSLVAAWKFGRHSLYLRASTLKREVKLQYSLKL